MLSTGVYNRSSLDPSSCLSLLDSNPHAESPTVNPVPFTVSYALNSRPCTLHPLPQTPSPTEVPRS